MPATTRLESDHKCVCKSPPDAQDRGEDEPREPPSPRTESSLDSRPLQLASSYSRLPPRPLQLASSDSRLPPKSPESTLRHRLRATSSEFASPRPSKAPIRSLRPSRAHFAIESTLQPTSQGPRGKSPRCRRSVDKSIGQGLSLSGS